MVPQTPTPAFLWISPHFPSETRLFPVSLASNLNCLRQSRHRAETTGLRLHRLAVLVFVITSSDRLVCVFLYVRTWHFFVTLLTPADDPNTFELVARNLKMKARGNQKNKEPNQIKSSPHDTENHQKIVQNQPKIDGNRGLDWSWGLLGEAWEPFGLPRPSGTEKRSQMTKK